MPASRRPLRAARPTSIVLAGALLLGSTRLAAGGVPAGAPIVTLDTLARAYVELVLAIGKHDPNYVDAYYGPAEWRETVEKAGLDLGELAGRAQRLLDELDRIPREPHLDSSGAEARQTRATHPPDRATAELLTLRRAYLGAQLRSATARVAMLRGKRFTFDQESRALYDAVAPHHDEAFFRAILTRLDAVLTGSDQTLASRSDARSLPERLEVLRRQVTIPPDKVGAVFDRAIAECRRRTAGHIELPPGETFTVEMVHDKPWSAYNWYQGGYRSVIQVNISLPILIDRALDLACHEGYPGHHVYNVLLERHLVRGLGWPEFQVYPLFSPQSLIAEGTANYGIAMAFPGEERLAFERDVLYPLAGLDPRLAEPYDRVRQLLDELSYAGNEAARRYLDGTIDATAAADWLVRWALMSPERAAQRVKFFDTYRSYVINYNLGQDLVRAWVEGQAGRAQVADRPASDGQATAARRWEVFAGLLSSPRLPSGLAVPSPGTR